MALPPEMLSELLPRAGLVVVGEVTRVDDTGTWPRVDRGAPLDAAPPRPSQRAHLRVSRTLRGHVATDELVVDKPAGSYALHAGVFGVFLLASADAPVILGRYGPDTFSVDEVERAMTLPVTA